MMDLLKFVPNSRLLLCIVAIFFIIIRAVDFFKSTDLQKYFEVSRLRTTRWIISEALIFIFSTLFIAMVFDANRYSLLWEYIAVILLYIYTSCVYDVSIPKIEIKLFNLFRPIFKSQKNFKITLSLVQIFLVGLLYAQLIATSSIFITEYYGLKENSIFLIHAKFYDESHNSANAIIILYAALYILARVYTAYPIKILQIYSKPKNKFNIKITGIPTLMEEMYLDSSLNSKFLVFEKEKNSKVIINVDKIDYIETSKNSKLL
ncbi:hypothetical protein [Paenibacillus sp. MZ03-122A]|uniref:hypothetical protein n=1 Tax=Paenibacillus sp. MZ03-122A TaxID=2962033 RepID=UPI0020B7AA32|nr:hypothetical protein [Paenibacillus sp. MZ03-122A]MCP3778840.1 hypothetical protein [Paenibacillus sp. MZ03-122A]